MSTRFFLVQVNWVRFLGGYLLSLASELITIGGGSMPTRLICCLTVFQIDVPTDIGLVLCREFTHGAAMWLFLRLL